MKLVFASAIALVLSGLASGCSSAPNDAVGTSGEDLSAAAAASPTAATSTVVRDPICPTGEKPCRVEEPDGKCGEVCVRDTALCVAPPKCEPSATSSAAAASDDRPTAATSTVVKDPICPTGEKPCRVEDPDGKCGEVCVRDTALCVAPPKCDPSATPSAATALAASPTAATSIAVDPICPVGEKLCPVEESDGKCGEVCVRDTALCVAPPKCSPSARTAAVAATASPTAATSTVVKDPICPVGEKLCRVEESDGKCGEVCVRDTALCVAPPKCEPSATAASSSDGDSTTP